MEFTENDHQITFDQFWTNMKKYIFPACLKLFNRKMEKNKKNTISRRTQSFFFYLKKGFINIKVCKKMFIISLFIGE